jgi:hypothetical protein
MAHVTLSYINNAYKLPNTLKIHLITKQYLFFFNKLQVSTKEGHDQAVYTNLKR